MLGDLVTFRDCQKDTSPAIIKIWQINADNEAFVSIDGNDGLDEISIDDEIVGIFITPEILEKNGFEFLYSSLPGGSLQEQRRKKVDTYKWHGLVINYFHENSDFQIMDIRRVRFNYVHELQHALRLCGIEKEINLRPGATEIV